MKALLRAKHWQIFSLTFGIPVLVIGFLTIRLMWTAIYTAQHSGTSDPEAFLESIIYDSAMPFGAVVFIAYAITALWQFSIVDYAVRHKLPSNYPAKKGLFLAALIIPLIYVLFMNLAGLYTLDYIINKSNGFPVEGPPMGVIGAQLITFPVALLSIASQFYIYYRVAHALVSAERPGETITLSECIVEAVLLWFNFIGIWILQPRINKLLEENPTLQDGQA